MTGRIEKKTMLLKMEDNKVVELTMLSMRIDVAAGDVVCVIWGARRCSRCKFGIVSNAGLVGDMREDDKQNTEMAQTITYVLLLMMKETGCRQFPTRLTFPGGSEQTRHVLDVQRRRRYNDSTITNI